MPSATQQDATSATKLSYVRAAVKRGTSETIWDETKAMRLAQQLGDAFVYSTPGLSLDTSFRPGGVAWIMPSRWVADDVIPQVIIPGYSIVVTRRTRGSSQHWLLVYLRSRHELPLFKQLRTWLRNHPLQGTSYVAGDFNSLPAKHEQLWAAFLA